MEDKIIVSVYCLAFNHEKYIKDALEGFVNQKTDFKYEVFVHDDASTDSTALIINEYAKAYPEVIKPIIQRENQYSKGVDIFTEYIRPLISGKYIAMCEGDDYWTDEYKLQKQYEAMEQHPECDMCVHRGNLFDCRKNKIVNRFPEIVKDCILTLEETIYGEGAFLATSSLFYRREVKTQKMEFQKKWDLDYTIQIRGAIRGGIIYLADTMSTYRWFSEGSWSNANSSIDKERALVIKRKEMLEILDKELEHRYHSIIAKRMRKNEFCLLLKEEKYHLARKQKEFWEEIPYKIKMIYWMKKNIPILYSLMSKIRYMRVKNSDGSN